MEIYDTISFFQPSPNFTERMIYFFRCLFYQENGFKIICEYGIVLSD